MSNGLFKTPYPDNEPVMSYAVGSTERKSLKDTLSQLRLHKVDIPMYIGGEEVYTDKKVAICPPHDHKHVLGHFNEGKREHITQAILAATEAKKSWSTMSWEHRASIFLKAADLIAGKYRYQINAATMLGQSKNAFQAEIDAVCETIDFLRFNVHFMHDIYTEQPVSSPNIWNRMEYRPLEGFVLAITPFNFTAIGVNLATSVAMMGNTVLWKPAYTQIYSAHVAMQALREAGLPGGVINMIYTDGPETGDVVFQNSDFGGIHFTGSTTVFKTIWKTIGKNIDIYRSYPRIVGESGGKDFIIAHQSADAEAVATAIIRGGFEYQGQKCSAASRCYIPSNLWPAIKKQLLTEIATLQMGPVENFENFVNAVIDEKAFDKIARYIDQAKGNTLNTILAGGTYDKSNGYFIQPTLIESKDPMSPTMCEEIFGPVVTVYVYNEENFESTLELVDQTSPYALTGAIFSRDRYAVEIASKKLVQSAGNFYINDKPTGAVVGQQPFGGARGSGTNDKAGAKMNLLRWTSMRTIKETFVPSTDYHYPFMEKE